MRRDPHRAAPSGRVRIIGGSLRNSRLDVPELPGLRPTPERVRETVFNWLASVIAGATSADQVRANANAGTWHLSDSDLETINKIAPVNR